ncbi:hypothetical protein E8E13_005364 [Curvularia kusanoi]|uniref:Uncharacterized protein n=1 Tax=Curvularia kusanoi TaxID=90978 RepID=A0A9P4T7W1_CURKU|nr:hypothetical protein E8E13_005364 [Curvularia kusanoi]
MGSGQSQPRAISPEPYKSPEERAQAQEERAQAQAEMRAKQQAALDKRFAHQQRKPSPSADAPRDTSKKPSALEQMSRENLGWRNADTNHEMRSWN